MLPQGSHPLGGGKNLLGMAADRDLGPDADNPEVGTHQERRAYDAHEFAAIHRFFLPYPVSVEHPVLFIGCKRDSELLLGLEFVLRRYRIGRNAEDFRADPAEGAAEP